MNFHQLVKEEAEKYAESIWNKEITDPAVMDDCQESFLAGASYGFKLAVKFLS